MKGLSNVRGLSLQKCIAGKGSLNIPNNIVSHPNGVEIPGQRPKTKKQNKQEQRETGLLEEIGALNSHIIYCCTCNMWIFQNYRRWYNQLSNHNTWNSLAQLEDVTNLMIVYCMHQALIETNQYACQSSIFPIPSSPAVGQNSKTKLVKGKIRYSE